MSDRKTIRRLIARDIDAVLSLMLTDQQWDVLQFVSKFISMQSHIISSEFGISPQHTANIMATLYHKGYVKRKKRISPSGGHEYSFTAII